MNYNEHIANDLLDNHKVRTLKTDENNKENAQATGKYLANVSISSLGAGILSETQLNMSNNGLLSSASFFNPNEITFTEEKQKLEQKNQQEFE
jgi:hypothetical protein